MLVSIRAGKGIQLCSTSEVLPKCDRRANKEYKLCDIESSAFRPITDELWKDALESEPRDGQRDRIDRRHPHWKGGVPQCHENGIKNRCNRDHCEQGRVGDEQDPAMTGDHVCDDGL